MARDPARDRAIQQRYRAAHLEECRERVRIYRAAHREQAHVRSVAWRAAHRGEVRAYNAAWRTEHPGYDQAWRNTVSGILSAELSHLKGNAKERGMG